jgi:hypothetical protein
MRTRGGRSPVTRAGTDPAMALPPESSPRGSSELGLELCLTRGGNPLRVRNVFGSGGFTVCRAPRGPKPCGVVCFRRCGPSGHEALRLPKHRVLGLLETTTSTDGSSLQASTGRGKSGPSAGGHVNVHRSVWVCAPDTRGEGGRGSWGLGCMSGICRTLAMRSS